MTQTNDNASSFEGETTFLFRTLSSHGFEKGGFLEPRNPKILDRAPQTINNEVKSGRIYDYYYIYDTEEGQAAYEKHRLNFGRHPK